MTLQEKILYCRRRAGLSQEALAEQLGVSRQAISKWENGAAEPEIGKLRALAEAFDVSTDWLLSEDGPEVLPPQNDENPLLTAFAQHSSDDGPTSTTTRDRSSDNSESASPWPHWVDSLPGFFGRMIRRYGWLFGVRTALSGAAFLFFGVLAKLLNSSMNQTFDSMGGFGYPGDFGFSTGETIWYDESGKQITGSLARELNEALSSEIGPTFTSTAVSMTDPFDLLANAFILLGVVIVIAGILLAVYLKKWGEKSPQ